MKYTLLNKKKRYLFQLWEDEILDVSRLPDAELLFVSIKDEVMTIKKGYAWDGSSIPLKRYFRWIYDADKYCKTPSLLHDALCQLIREEKLDKKYKYYADGRYYSDCKSSGMSQWEALRRYEWLRRFKKIGTKRDGAKLEILEA